MNRNMARVFAMLTFAGFSACRGGTVFLEPVGSWPGYSRGSMTAICSGANYLYAAMADGGIVVLDLSNPSRPSAAGGCPGPKSACDIVAKGEMIYVANGEQGLSIFEVKNPKRPRLVGTIQTLGSAVSVRVAGELAYVADDDAGLLTVDISKPEIPRILGRWPSCGETHAVSLFGHYACVADHDAGLQVIDIQDPRNPARVGSAAASGYASDIVVHRDHAYLSVEDQGLLVFDLAEPPHPKLVHTYRSYTNRSVVMIQGDLLYAYNAGDRSAAIWDVRDPTRNLQKGSFNAHYASQFSISGGSLYALSSVGIAAFDLGKPGTPAYGEEASFYRLTSDLCVSSNYAYLAGRGSGLEVLDVHERSSPRLVSSVSAFTNSTALHAEGGRLYVCADGLFWILDIRDPVQPVILSQCPLESQNSGSLYLPAEGNQIILSNSQAYIACDFDSRRAVVIDVENPRQPKLIKELKQDFLGRQSVGKGGPACLFLSKHVIDVSQPEQPVLVGQLGGWAISGRSFCLPGYVFLPDLLGHLSIYETGKEGFPRTTFDFTNGCRPRDVAVAEGLAYVADDRGYVHVLDVSEVQKPLWLNAVRAPGSPLQVATAEQHVFVATGPTGLQLFRVSRRAQVADVTSLAELSETAQSTRRGNRILRKLPGVSQPQNERPTFSGEELVVIEALLEHEFHGMTNTIVLDDESGFGPSARGPARNNLGLQTAMEKEAEKDFLQKNQKPMKIGWQGAGPTNVVLLSKEALGCLFRGKHSRLETGWTAFYAQFPDAHGIAEISRVGIDSKGTVAVVYFGIQSHYLAGSGGVRLLRKKEGKWVVERHVGGSWVS